MPPSLRALSSAVVLLVAMTASVAAQTEDGPNYREREAALLEAYPDLIARDGARLTFQTESDGPVIIEDCPDCSDESIFAAISYLEPFDSFVVFGLWNGEDAGYALVQRKAGTVHWLAAEPVPDPSGTRYVAVGQRTYELPERIKIGVWTGSEFVIEVDQTMGSTFVFETWSGPDRIDLSCVSGPCVARCVAIREEGGADATCSTSLLRQDNGWHFVETMSLLLPQSREGTSTSIETVPLPEITPPLGSAVPGWEKSACGRKWTGWMTDANLVELRLREDYPDNLKRDHGTLRIVGSDSGVQVYKDVVDSIDECYDGKLYRTEAYFDALDAFFVMTHYYEGAAYALVDRRTAAATPIAAPPETDWTGRCFAAIASGDGYDEPGVQIGCHDGSAIAFEADWHGWGYQLREWVGPDRIDLTSLRGPYRLDGERSPSEQLQTLQRDVRATAYLQRIEGRWHLIETVAMPLGLE